MDHVRIVGYFPGAIGRVTEMHGAYYKEHCGFDLFFESKVATELSEFLNRLDPRHDGFWVALVDNRIVGAIAIDGNEAKTRGSRLRWFIVAPEIQGRGIGRKLLREAIDFCRRSGTPRIFLHTFAGLDSARTLYEATGFCLCEEHEDRTWGKPVKEQLFELVLG
jgi:GNAT superfamily N-acetyltransferase